MKKISIGFALCGSFCTFEAALGAMRALAGSGASLVPILSFNAASLDTRFGAAAGFRRQIEDICGRGVIDTIQDAEPIGPQKLCDIMIVAPCTGNTLSKLAAGITDTPVAMAVKSHLRGRRPVVIALSTNDALSGSAKNLGELLNRRDYYFVPMAQDAPDTKPSSMMADFSLIPKTIELALQGRQIQPIFLGPKGP